MTSTTMALLVAIGLSELAAIAKDAEKADSPAIPGEAQYRRFLLDETAFGQADRLKQQSSQHVVLEGSLQKKVQDFSQEALLPERELRTVTYMLRQSPLEACAVMYHQALTSATPGRLVSNLGSSERFEGADEVYVFTSAGNSAGLFLRLGGLLVYISVLNARDNKADATCDALARAVIRRARAALNADGRRTQ